MTPYSLDLRQRVIKALERGDGTQAELAEMFGVSLSCIQKWLRKWRDEGSIAPEPHGGGRQAKFSGKKLERLKQLVENNPDATLAELLRKSRVKGSIMSVFRALERLEITRKKRH